MGFVNSEWAIKGALKPNNNSKIFVDGQTFAAGTSGDTLIVPLLPGKHAFEVRALEQPPIFRTWQAW